MSGLVYGVIVLVGLQSPPPRPVEPPPIDPARPAQKETPPDHSQVQRILEEVKQTAEANAKADREKAHELQLRAEDAFGEGRLPDAVALIRKARRLDPDSASIRRLALHYEKLYESASAKHANLSLARLRLDEALAQARRIQDSDPVGARALAQAVFEAAGRFPASFDVGEQVEAARALLAGNKSARQAAGLHTPDCAPPRAPVDTRLALKTRLDAEWMRVPLSQALADLSANTGLVFIVDQPLAQLRWFDVRSITFSAQDLSAGRLLEEIMKNAGTDAVPGRDGRILLTTKQQALALAVQRSRQLPEVGLRSPDLGAQGRQAPVRSRNVPVESIPPPAEAPQSKPPAAAAPVPEYLRSPKAFRDSLKDLLAPPEAKEEPERIPLPPS
jgi:tetratricopeptide (TPR) repeat protein